MMILLPASMPLRSQVSNLNENAIAPAGSAVVDAGVPCDNQGWSLFDDVFPQDEVEGSASGKSSSSSVRSDTSSLTSDIDVQESDTESLRVHDDDNNR